MNPENIISTLRGAGLHPPEMLTIAITGQCNLACAHCWVGAGPSGAAPQIADHILMQLINDFQVLGGSGLRLTGGEPLLHPGCLKILRLAGESSLSNIILQTNAMLVGPAELSAFAEIDSGRLQLQVSLDGARAESHDLVRGTGAFRQTLEGLKKLVDHGFGPQLAIFFTEMRHNLLELPAVFSLAADLGIGSVGSGSLVRCGRADSDELIQPPKPEQYPLLLERWKTDEEFRRHYQTIGCVAALEWCQGESPEEQGCSFIKTPYLTADGVLFPCLMCHADAFSVAGVFEKGLSAALNEGVPLWASLQELSRSRVTELPECRECALLNTCGGGCMGRAWGSFGAFLVTEDRCSQRQAVRRWKENN